ncbi:MAG: sigma-70 family RNA polymerase sigma factor [Bacteroidales bacterium]|nr:sigma-70 family RNA polymerase sigma factor [Bacteroidales bacterium]
MAKIDDLNIEEILDGIRKNNNKVLLYVYKTFYPHIKFFINTNSGNDDDAKDIYQEAIIIIYKKVVYENLIISCSFKTYLYSVCRLLWLKQLEKRKIKNEQFRDNDDFIDVDKNILQVYEQNEKYKLYQEHFRRLGNDCQKVLKLSLEKVPLKEIALIMGYKSEKYAKKRKYQCKERLIKSIKSDPKFKELI